MLLLYGRRRLGKTFLLQRYFTAGVDGDEHEKPHCYFLAEQSTAATQRLTLARQLIAALASEGVSAEDIVVSWNALLRYASQQAKGRKKGAGRFALILDEFPYLVAQTPELPSILQAWWAREAVHLSLLRPSATVFSAPAAPAGKRPPPVLNKHEPPDVIPTCSVPPMLGALSGF
jgi:AAA+ ATPase superfamily predicted ATPase